MADGTGIQYVNRRGERYYLLQGVTKTGKPKYYMSRKNAGTPAECVPKDYEIYEEPERGLVSVRKIRPTRVLPQEREQLATWTRELAGIEHFRVEVEDDSLVIYTPTTDPAEAADALDRIMGVVVPGATEANREWIGSHATYLPMLRFALLEEDGRLFSAERWCFLGGINDWFPLMHGKPLQWLAKKYLPHLNRDSFFELM